MGVWNCCKNGLKLVYKWSVRNQKRVWKLVKNGPESGLKLNWKWSETDLKLGQNWFTTDRASAYLVYEHVEKEVGVDF